MSSTVYEKRWKFGYKHLLEFVKREGHARVPQNHIEGKFALGNWVSYQRRKRYAGKLKKQRAEKLERTAGWVWNARTEYWQVGYQYLVCFVEREGHANVHCQLIEQGFKLGSWVHTQRKRKPELSSKQKRALENLPDLTWSQCDTLWDEHYSSLVAFVNREGHARVKRNHIEKGFPLGNWVAQQRKRKDKLSKKRTNLLAILPGWTWDIIESRWWEHYDELFERAQKAKGVRHIRRSKATRYGAQGFDLSNWAAHLRINRNELPHSKKRALEKIPGWSWAPSKDAWNEKYQCLLRFVEREGHACVLKRHREGDIYLGDWVVKLRQSKKSDKLSARQIKALEKLPGWSWDTAASDWEAYYQSVMTFISREKHAHVPQKHRENGLEIGTWVNNKRIAHRKGRLTDDKIKQLEALPGWTWEPEEERYWKMGFDHLLEFLRREGHAGVPLDHVEGQFTLGYWLEEQIVAYQESTLSPEQERKLENLNIFW